MSLAFFAGGAPGPLELLVILAVILLLFGAKRLPELSRSLGKSLSEFKKGKEEGARMLDHSADAPPKDVKARDGDDDGADDGAKKSE